MLPAPSTRGRIASRRGRAARAPRRCDGTGGGGLGGPGADPDTRPTSVSKGLKPRRPILPADDLSPKGADCGAGAGEGGFALGWEGGALGFARDVLRGAAALVLLLPPPPFFLRSTRRRGRGASQFNMARRSSSKARRFFVFAENSSFNRPSTFRLISFSSARAEGVRT